MANTATTATVLDMTTDAGFRAWVAEIINTFTSTLTLTQTADTGQINTATVTRPGATNTAAGYAMFRFNDTLQSTAPCFIKLEFGTNGTATTGVQMWVTVGTGSNGTGTITGNQTSRMVVCYGNGAPTSNVTSYTSRFVYNATYGFLGLCWKQNGNNNGATTFVGGFQIFRSNDNTGAATGDAINLLTSYYSGPGGTTSSMGYLQTISALTTALYPTTLSSGNQWQSGAGAGGMAFGATTTSYSGNAQVFPIIYQTPVFSFSAYLCYGLISEQPMGSTFTCAVVGSTSLTFLSVGQPWGSSYLGQNSTTTVGLHMLWQ